MRDVNLLLDLEPGLVKLAYSSQGNPKEELALKFGPTMTHILKLPNGILCYKTFLREKMEGNPVSHFFGPEVRDEYLEGVEGNLGKRIIRLNSAFGDLNKNFNPVLIMRSNPYFKTVVSSLKSTLFNQGCPKVDASKWNDYELWESEELKTFK
jgi:hypothetical protein